MFNLLIGKLALPFILLIVLASVFAVALLCYLGLLFYYRNRDEIKYNLKKSEKGREKRKQEKILKRQAEKDKKSKYRDAITSADFDKIKKRYLLSVIIKSVICGISFGLFVVGLLLLILKLQGIPFNIGYYILIGVICAILCGGITFLIFKPTNKKVAKAIDNDYTLKERVQTSLVFSRENGAVVQLQRDDANEKIANLPKTGIRFSKVWQYFLIGVLSVALIVTALFIPAKTVEGETPDPGIDNPTSEITEYTIVGVREIIENVKLSNLDEETKGSTVDALERFLASLEDYFNRDEEMSLNIVYNIISQTEDIITGATSFARISNALLNAEQTTLANILLRGGESYKKYSIKEFNQTRDFYTSRLEIIDSAIAEAVTDFRKEFILTISDGLVDKLNASATAIVGAISSCGVATTEALYESIVYFATDLSLCAVDVVAGAFDDVGVQGALDVLVNDLNSEISPELAVQSYYYSVNAYISSRLKTLFGIPQDDNPGGSGDDDDNPGNNPGDDDDNTSDNQGSGGYGDGTIQYPSDDQVYDPRTGKTPKYSEVLGDYYAMVQEYLQENGEAGDDRTLTDEQRKIIEAYFNALFGAE